MPLSPFQRAICRLIAENRIASGESYVAGGAAIGELIGGARLSEDIDLFHDTEEALVATWRADRTLLEASGYVVRPLRERPSFVEAEVARQSEAVRIQWVHDSAYRFFPLLTHDELGLVLHPLDLATNKLLALVGRVEVRDWIDTIQCHDALQPLGYLAWAACGKDAGFSPVSILEHAARSTRYSSAEVAELAFTGPPPDVAALLQRWRNMLQEARELIALLPADQVGRCVLLSNGELCRASTADLPDLLARSALIFHEGHVRGALPRIVGT
jgi:hypothetical protein